MDLKDTESQLRLLNLQVSMMARGRKNKRYIGDTIANIIGAVIVVGLVALFVIGAVHK